MPIEVVIFSFNRGQLLLNCIRSLREFMPDSPITVFDDRSTDKETRGILEGLDREGRITILTGPSRLESVRCTRAYGGLFENIQSFVDVHARSSCAIFLQDDTQIVRRFTEHDREEIERIFSEHQTAAFVYPSFLTHNSYSKYVDPTSLTSEGLTFSFVYDYEYSGYFDVCIAHIDRLRKAGWKFGDELQTSLAARERFGTMRLMRHPFVAHLPSPPTFRERGRTWVQEVWEYYRSGLYPVDSLSDSNLLRLFSMKGTFPTAESFLTSENFWGQHPWPYAKLDEAPRPILFLDRVESRFRRGLKRLLR
jgi:hypothetical protein